MKDTRHPRIDVIGTPISVVSLAGARDRIIAWARAGDPRYVCCTNVHVTVTARGNDALRHALESADMVTPDGAPLIEINSERIDVMLGVDPTRSTYRAGRWVRPLE